MSMDARLAELAATSYPYRWISRYLGIPYWAVLAYRDNTPTGQLARECVFDQHEDEVRGLRELLTIVEVSYAHGRRR